MNSDLPWNWPDPLRLDGHPLCPIHCSSKDLPELSRQAEASTESLKPSKILWSFLDLLKPPKTLLNPREPLNTETLWNP